MRTWTLATLMVLVLVGGARAEDQKRCGQGWITCQAWCQKWRDSSTGCLYTHPMGCMKRYHSLKYCVKDAPPRD